MFLDLGNHPPPPPPWEPERKAPRITPGEERVLISALCVLLALLFIAPLAGASLVDAALAVWRSV